MYITLRKISLSLYCLRHIVGSLLEARSQWPRVGSFSPLKHRNGISYTWAEICMLLTAKQPQEFSSSWVEGAEEPQKAFCVWIGMPVFCCFPHFPFWEYWKNPNCHREPFSFQLLTKIGLEEWNVAFVLSTCIWIVVKQLAPRNRNYFYACIFFDFLTLHPPSHIMKASLIITNWICPWTDCKDRQVESVILVYSKHS